ncbi:roadblock/LC7 domain-containing protein [Kitasatospora sp. NBC_01246]|uniref:roadblock/LC7 domain-containing protein n=1 Tax=Kitasatospora sp. NBC_01246 TaxID=2903570 RepID=UPI002E2EE4CC|nr:roadblock/LC7 domain-containing protein [Kitasatospora sp. NBC_01246]
MNPHPHLPVLGDLVAGTAGAVAAIHVSSEGLVLGTSPGIGRDEADTWAALMSGLGAMSSRSVGVVGHLTSGEHPWGHSVIEDRAGRTMTLVGAADHSMLAVVGAEGADLGEIAARLIVLADRGLAAAVAA